jgi:dethiobiotin synthetase
MLRLPLAPAIAAGLEGVTIKKKKILSSCNYLLKKYDFTVVEGAGGIMVPVYRGSLFLDLIKDINLPIVIVSRPGLGTINHTLLTIKAAQSRKINILGVIINHSSKTRKDMSEKTNPGVIEKLGRIPLLGIVQYTKNKTPHKKLFHKLAEKLIKKV